MRSPSIDSICAAFLLGGVLVVMPSETGKVAEAPSPYAGEEQRPVKALSPERVNALLAGAGLGFAKTAELNSYPGPVHALELTVELEMTTAQRAAAQAAFERMRADAKRLGTAVVDKEVELDRLFASKEIDAERLRQLTQEIAVLEGHLRYTHLAAHLEMRRILTPEQFARYDRLRGYGASADAPQRHQHHGEPASP
jgi:Spy/CpxP family protein refolding chaperone